MDIQQLNNVYAAGLFDGEGTVTLIKQGKLSKFKAPTVSLTSTTYELIKFMKDNYGGHIRNQKVYKEHHKKAYCWQLRYNNALEFLTKLNPYIKEPAKKKRIELLINKYKKVTKSNGKYSEQEAIKKHAFEEEFFTHTVSSLPENVK